MPSWALKAIPLLLPPPPLAPDGDALLVTPEYCSMRNLFDPAIASNHCWKDGKPGAWNDRLTVPIVELGEGSADGKAVAALPAVVVAAVVDAGGTTTEPEKPVAPIWNGV
jgi:hypothetical protein